MDLRVAAVVRAVMHAGVNCSGCAAGTTSDDEHDVVAYFAGYETPDNRVYWWIVDYLVCDVIYILDIVFVKRRLRFINNGMLQVRLSVCLSV